MTPDPPPILPGRYRHFKGGEYEVLGLSTHSETGERLVVYRPLYNDSGLWVRPLAMFAEPVAHGGRTVPRFAPVGPSAAGDELIGGAALDPVRRAVEQVAATRATVLVVGETGTGKELVARAVHARSGRAGPLVPVHCASMPEALVESELFGHEKGAFTGAVAARRGRFELAHGGTLFLDEVADLPPAVQVKLLRALQERTIERVGGEAAVGVDVRVVAATNRPLEPLVREGRFREDLFYRLNVVPIALPPLRERPGDVPPLARHFLAKFAAEHARPVTDVSPDTLRLLARYRWPGNVRELQNVVERGVVVSAGPLLVVAPEWLASAAAETGRTWAAEERERIAAALRAAGGRVYGPGGAAHRLGLKPTTLYGKMRKHGIARDPADGG